MKHKLVSVLLGEISVTSDRQMTPTLWQKAKKSFVFLMKKSLLIKAKEESEKVVLKLSIQKVKIVAPGPINSWQIYGKTVQTVADFTFLGSKVTADCDCGHEIKRRFLLRRKVMTNLDIEKQRHYFANKGLSSQGYGFYSGHLWM